VPGLHDQSQLRSLIARVTAAVDGAHDRTDPPLASPQAAAAAWWSSATTPRTSCNVLTQRCTRSSSGGERGSDGSPLLCSVGARRCSRLRTTAPSSPNAVMWATQEPLAGPCGVVTTSGQRPR
jgi:hypothetical protein